MKPNQKRNIELLTEKLKDYTPGRIYSLAPRGQVLDAMTLVRRNPVLDINWSTDGLYLNLEVADIGISEVAISIAREELAFSCDCGMKTGCSHLIVALTTLKKLLSPDSFQDIPFSEHYLKDLSRLLLGSDDNPGYATIKAPLRLVVEKGSAGISVRAWRGGAPLNRQSMGLTKREHRFLDMVAIPGHRNSIIKLFQDIFSEDTGIFYRDGENEIPLKYFADSIRETRTLIDLNNGIVNVHKVFDDAIPLGKESFATGEYFFNITERSIEPIASVSGWRLWNDFNYAAAALGEVVTRDSKTISIGIREFGQLSVPYDENIHTNDVILMINGSAADIERRQFTAEMHVSEIDPNRFRLFCCMVADNLVYSLAGYPFGMLTEDERWRLTAPLKTKKRFSVLVQACFDLLSCNTQKEQSSLLKSLFSGENFIKRVVVSDAKRFAKAFVNNCIGSEPLLLTDGKSWLSFSLDRSIQASLLEIPFRMFGASALSETTLPGEMIVSRTDLMPRLLELQSKVESAGFKMLFNGKSVRSVNWDITVDATRSTIDWFELKPEVFCDGKMVSSKEMEEALNGGGIYHKDGEFVMLDSQTSAILSLFPGQAKGRKKSDMVRIPRLQILDWLHLRKSGIKVKLSPDDENIFSSLASFEDLPVRELPQRLDATLRHYQYDGYNWLAFLYEHRFGACLADDMGLGKTIQAISLLAGLYEGKIALHLKEKLPHLIVVPPSLLFNWESEILRFYPDIKVTTYRGAERTTDFEDADVVLTSYGIVQRDVDKLSEIRFNVIVFDEAQAVKNIQTETTGACRRLKGHFTLVLTGTPVENHLGEYFSVMDIAVPGLLGEYETFRRSMNRGEASFLDMLIRRTRPFILRRTKSMIASELPPKIETDIYLELTDRQKALYTKTVAEVKATVEEAYRNKTAGQARIIALTAILRLRQLCLSPALMIPNSREASPKIDFLIDQLEELFDEGHSVLVFSQFTSYLNIVETCFKEKKLDYLRLDGSTDVNERKKLVNRFQKSEEPLAFLLSLKAGGKGLNLTRATYVFHLDPWWNPAVEDQASDRAHRIGQTRQVTITRLVMRHTIEEKMMELKRRKLKLYKALLEDATTSGGAGISREDFEYLLGG